MTSRAQEEINSVGNIGRELDGLRRTDELHERMIGLVIIVLFIGFFALAVGLGAILVDDFRSKEASYTDLVKAVDQQNAELNTITNGLQKYKIIP